MEYLLMLTRLFTSKWYGFYGLLISINACFSQAQVLQEAITEPLFSLEQRGKIHLEGNLSQLGIANNEVYLEQFDKHESLSWHIFFDKKIDLQSRPGLLIYISPSKSGEIPKPWKKLLSEKNLIWISANNAGNKTQLHRRVMHTLLGVNYIQKYIKFNHRRIYIFGFSGGARTASMIMPEFSNLFSGAIYIGGANSFSLLSAEKLKILRNKRYVFIAGSKDFNLRSSRKVYKQYLHSGLKNSLFLKLSRQGHELPKVNMLEKAITFLDSNE